MSGIIINGILGHMGREVEKAALQKNSLLAGVDFMASSQSSASVPVFKSFDEIPQTILKEAHCIVDFSNHLCTKALVDFAVEKNLALVIATTGQTEEELKMITDASSKVPVFFAANYSLGVAVLIKLAKNVASVMKDADIEIVETHHNRKLDAPSGTAKAIAQAVQEVRPNSKIVCGRSGMCKRNPEDIGISSVRYGNIVGIHEVHVGTENECITLKHEAFSRSVFADGAVAAAEFIEGKGAGMYGMESMITL